MIMIPIGVLVILILRNLIGLQTLGTFTPVLIALAFRETGLQWGIALFTVITALGLSLRSYLEHLKLQMLPRLSVVLTFVVVMIAVISGFHHHLAHQVAGAAAAHRGHALAAQAEQLAGLGAFRNLQLDPAIQGRHFQLATQRSVGETDRHFAVQMLAVALEDRVLAHIDHHVQVARRIAVGHR